MTVVVYVKSRLDEEYRHYMGWRSWVRLAAMLYALVWCGVDLYASVPPLVELAGWLVLCVAGMAMVFLLYGPPGIAAPLVAESELPPEREVSRRRIVSAIVIQVLITGGLVVCAVDVHPLFWGPAIGFAAGPVSELWVRTPWGRRETERRARPTDGDDSASA